MFMHYQLWVWSPAIAADRSEVGRLAPYVPRVGDALMMLAGRRAGGLEDHSP